MANLLFGALRGNIKFLQELFFGRLIAPLEIIVTFGNEKTGIE
jgi:hypothetical protein